MKWYFSINEAGTRSDVGLHAKLAVLSAKERTNLDPILLYTGQKGEFTEWMGEHGVEVLTVSLPFENRIIELEAHGIYSTAFTGHWLRSMICNIEQVDEIVLYTDCDIIFLSQPALQYPVPRRFACAPEFKQDNWNYVNTGVMYINVQGLREDYREFENYIIEIISRVKGVNDQYAYNQFYRRRWDKLDVKLNWKPYWGPSEDVSVLHFHGPKLGAIQSIIEGEWSWDNNYGKQLGSLLVGHLDGYIYALSETIHAIGNDDTLLKSRLIRTLENLQDFGPKAPKGKVDLNFMNFRLFGD